MERSRRERSGMEGKTRECERKIEGELGGREREWVGEGANRRARKGDQEKGSKFEGWKGVGYREKSRRERRGVDGEKANGRVGGRGRE